MNKYINQEGVSLEKGTYAVLKFEALNLPNLLIFISNYFENLKPMYNCWNVGNIIINRVNDVWYPDSISFSADVYVDRVSA